MRRTAYLLAAALCLSLCALPAARAQSGGGPVPTPAPTETMVLTPMPTPAPAETPVLSPTPTPAPAETLLLTPTPTPAPVETPVLPPDPAPAPPPQQENAPRTCATAEELRAVLEEDCGGTVVLTADIQWDDWGMYDVTRPLTVRMEGYSITIPKDDYLSVRGPVRFEGGAGPLFRVYGELGTWRGVEIAAEGEDAVAIWLRCDTDPVTDHQSGWWSSELAEISARGPGAAALAAEGTGWLRLEQTALTAEGEGAVAVRSELPMAFFLCALRGDAAAAEVPAGGLVLDGCTAEPMPEGARVVRRVARPSRLAEEGYSVPVGAVWEDGFFSWEEGMLYAWEENAEFYFCDVEGRADTSCPLLDVTWTGAVTDASAPLETVARCAVQMPDWFPVEVPSFDVPLHVVPPERPHLASAFRMGSDTAVIRYLLPIRDADAITLWYRPAEGGAWRDAAELPQGYVDEGGASLIGLEPNRDYLFRLEVEGGPMAGTSAELPFRYYDTDPDRAGSGDRDDDDRDDQGEEPPNGEIIPPPEEDPNEESSPPPEEPGGEPAPPPEEDGPPGENSTPSAGGAGEEDEPPAGRPERDPDVSAPGRTESPAPPPPAATPEPTPAPAVPEGATEAFTTGELADQLLANPEQVTLIGEGLRAALPAALLRGLALEEGETFAAALERPAPDRFSVRFWAGERALDGLGGPFTVEVDWTGGGTPPRCLGPDGVWVTAAETGDGRAVFLLTAAGDYTISAATVPAAAPETEAVPPESPAPSASAVPAPTSKGRETPAPAAEPVRPSPAGTEPPAGPAPPVTAGPEQPPPEADGGRRTWPALLLLTLCGAGAAGAWLGKRRRGA